MTDGTKSRAKATRTKEPLIIEVDVDGDSDIGEVLSRIYEQVAKQQASRTPDDELVEKIREDGYRFADQIRAIGDGILIPSVILGLSECLASALTQIDDTDGLRTSCASDVVSLMTAVISGEFDQEDK